MSRTLSRAASFIIFLVLFHTVLYSNGFTSEEILGQFYEEQNIPEDFSDMVFESLITSEKEGKRQTSHSQVFMRNPSEKLVFFKDSGGRKSAVLIRENSGWIYSEGLRTTLKIKLNFNLSNDLNISDLIGINLLSDYRTGDLSLSADEGYRFLLTASSDELAYRHIDIFAHEESGEIYKMVYMDINMNPLKQADISYIDLDGRKMPEFRISNLVFGGGGETVLSYSAVYERKLPSSYYFPNVNSMTQFLRAMR